MPVPNHQADCQTALWPAICRDCGDDVFFFSCTCGSKVYFDIPEPPWNPHEDRCIRYQVRYLIEAEGASPDRLLQKVRERALDLGVAIPPDVHRALLALQAGARPERRIQRIAPSDEERFALGEIVELNPHVNFYKRFKMDENPISRGLLGKLTGEAYTEIALREEPDPLIGQINEYICFGPAKLVQRAHVGLRAQVLAVLRPHRVLAGQRIWLAVVVQRVPLQPA